MGSPSHDPSQTRDFTPLSEPQCHGPENGTRRTSNPAGWLRRWTKTQKKPLTTHCFVSKESDSSQNSMTEPQRQTSQSLDSFFFFFLLTSRAHDKYLWYSLVVGWSVTSSNYGNTLWQNSLLAWVMEGRLGLRAENPPEPGLQTSTF